VNVKGRVAGNEGRSGKCAGSKTPKCGGREEMFKLTSKKKVGWGWGGATGKGMRTTNAKARVEAAARPSRQGGGRRRKDKRVNEKRSVGLKNLPAETEKEWTETSPAH